MPPLLVSHLVLSVQFDHTKPFAIGSIHTFHDSEILKHGELDIDGTLPVNRSGGFLSFGEATTAQGVLQVCELVW